MAAGLKTGDWVVFPGSGGGVGHMGVQLAKAMGFRVIGIDTGAEKKALCLRLGCEHFLDFKEVENVEKEVIKLTGGEGAHAVLVTTGSASAYKSAPSMVRPGGKIMCVGLREYSQRLPLRSFEESWLIWSLKQNPAKSSLGLILWSWLERI